MKYIAFILNSSSSAVLVRAANYFFVAGVTFAFPTGWPSFINSKVIKKTEGKKD